MGYLLRKNQRYRFAAYQSALYNVATSFVALRHESPEESVSVFACRLRGWLLGLVVMIQDSQFNRGMTNHIYTRCLLRVLLVDCCWLCGSFRSRLVGCFVGRETKCVRSWIAFGVRDLQVCRLDSWVGIDLDVSNYGEAG